LAKNKTRQRKEKSFWTPIKTDYQDFFRESFSAIIGENLRPNCFKE